MGHGGHAWHRLSWAGPGGQGCGVRTGNAPEQPVITDKYRPGAGSQRRPWAPANHRPGMGTLQAPTPALGLGKGWLVAPVSPRPHPGVGEDPRGWCEQGSPPAPPWPCQGGWARVSFPGAVAVPATSPGVQLIPGAGAASVTLLPPVAPPPSEGCGGPQPPRSVPPVALRPPRALGPPCRTRPEDPWPYPRAGTGRAARRVLQGPRQVPPSPGDPFGGGPGGAAGSPRRQ